MSTPAHTAPVAADSRLDTVVLPVDTHGDGPSEEGVAVGRMDIGRRSSSRVLDPTGVGTGGVRREGSTGSRRGFRVGGKS